MRHQQLPDLGAGLLTRILPQKSVHLCQFYAMKRPHISGGRQEWYGREQQGQRPALIVQGETFDKRRLLRSAGKITPAQLDQVLAMIDLLLGRRS